MYLYLLDAGGAGLIFVAIGAGLIFMAIAIALEALLMTGFKYHSFRRSMMDSTIVNLVSLVAGFVLLSTFGDVFHINSTGGFAAMFGVTVMIEFFVLYLLNKRHSLKSTAMVCILMNIITYTILYFFVSADF